MDQWIHSLMLTLEAAGVGVIGIGAAIATVWFAWAAAARRSPFEELYRLYRRRLGQAILLGLELLVAADIIRTVAVEPTLRSVTVLAIIVLVRTFLSMSLEVEMEGRFPWRRARSD